MNCEKIKESMSLYIDGELNEIEEVEFKEHIKNCDVCKLEMEQMLEVIDGLKSLPEIELPDNFHNEMMNSIKKESIKNIQDNNAEDNNRTDYTYKKTHLKRFVYKNWRAMSGITAAACFVFIIFSVSTIQMGSSKSAKEEMGAADTYGITSNFSVSDNAGIGMYGRSSEMKIGSAEVKVEETTAGTANKGIAENGVKLLGKEDSVENDLNKKIVKTANLSIQVYDFDGVINYLKDTVVQVGGYVENSNSYIRYTDPEKNINLKSGIITLKVPSEIYDSIVASTTGLGTVVQNNEYIDDVTSNYIDTESLLKAKRLEEQRLLAIMEKAETVEDLILLEQRLSTVRGDLEVYTGKINNWDRLIKFSTIIVNLEQIKQLEGTEISPTTLFGRMKKSFIYSIDNIKSTSGDIVVWAAKTLPILIILIIIAGTVLLASKIFIRMKYKKH